MPATSPTSADLEGAASGLCSVPTTFNVVLDQPAPAGGVKVTVADTVGGDTITTSPFTIPAGAQVGTFTVTPHTCGNRSISITTVPVLTITGSPVVYNSQCACPDDAGANSQSQQWIRGAITCPASFGVTFTMTPASTDTWAIDFYCTTGALSLTITE